jgi:hypothetical protein
MAVAFSPPSAVVRRIGTIILGIAIALGYLWSSGI